MVYIYLELLRFSKGRIPLQGYRYVILPFLFPALLSLTRVNGSNGLLTKDVNHSSSDALPNVPARWRLCGGTHLLASIPKGNNL